LQNRVGGNLFWWKRHISASRLLAARFPIATVKTRKARRIPTQIVGQWQAYPYGPHPVSRTRHKPTLRPPPHLQHTQADEQTETLRERRRQEEGQSLAEIGHMVTCDMLTECPEAAERGPGRVLTDRWRGMTSQQLSTIHREREAQWLQQQVH